MSSRMVWHPWPNTSAPGAPTRQTPGRYCWVCLHNVNEYHIQFGHTYFWENIKIGLGSKSQCQFAKQWCQLGLDSRLEARSGRSIVYSILTRSKHYYIWIIYQKVNWKLKNWMFFEFAILPRDFKISGHWISSKPIASNPPWIIHRNHNFKEM